MTTPISTVPAPEPSPPVRGSHRIEEMLLALLVLLSGAGVALNNYNPGTGFRYWMWMAPVFGIVTTIAAWSRAQRRGDPIGRIIPTQVLHWLGVAGAVYLVYLLQATGRMENEAAGITVLIVLGLAAFLAGIYSDWRLSVLGVILGAAAAAFAILDQILWVVVMPALLIGLIALIIYMRR